MTRLVGALARLRLAGLAEFGELTLDGECCKNPQVKKDAIDSSLCGLWPTCASAGSKYSL